MHRARFRLLIGLLFVGLSRPTSIVADEPVPPVVLGVDGRLIYRAVNGENRVPDFSYCGYERSERPIPDVPACIYLAPSGRDDGRQIQAAIDRLAQREQDARGFRGAIQLSPGDFHVATQLQVHTSGIVLRGCGATERGTTLHATGTDRRTLIRIRSSDADFNGYTKKQQADSPKPIAIVDDTIPVGATTVRCRDAKSFHVGQYVVVRRSSTAEWIQRLGLTAPGSQWKPGTRDITWLRQITHISADQLTLDAPLTMEITSADQPTIQSYDIFHRVSRVGVEDLSLVSDVDDHWPLDEDHAWFGISIDQSINTWVRRCRFAHFSGGAVIIGETARGTTVVDCRSELPVSEVAGYRRRTFSTGGELTLFLRCHSESGQNDFVVAHCAAGPNAFVNCAAQNAHGPSGTFASWATGVLFDNVHVDGNDLSFDNLWSQHQAAGWTAANCVLWQCQANAVRVQSPPSAFNWVAGYWSVPIGNAIFTGQSDFVKPLSLFQQQLRERVSDDAARHIGPLPISPVSATNPTVEQAADFVRITDTPRVTLVDTIRDRLAQATQVRLSDWQDSRVVPDDANEEKADNRDQVPTYLRPIGITRGYLTVDGRLKTGRLLSPVWWRGDMQPNHGADFDPALSRFAPGRLGNGWTDDLAQLAQHLADSSYAALNHHYGLWYDRRRDDHLMVGRSTADVQPPFFEQPFRRSGTGVAWDGLSRYDLTNYNPWYWNRLDTFAGRCDAHGLLLFHQHYFQHHVLEAGAHWVDCPWRPANNINNTELPEPPHFIGDKRIFMAHRFYDVTQPRLRELHRLYIRQCLDALKQRRNVIHSLSEEFSGPLEFVKFWLDTIIQWQQETEQDVLVSLAVTKDVQDTILATPAYREHIDIIDIRYWTYQADDTLYAPPGGVNLSPRQHLRLVKPATNSFASTVRSVHEYRQRYPSMAVTYNAPLHCRATPYPWAVLIGGGSLPAVTISDDLAVVVPQLATDDKISTTNGTWCLSNNQTEALIYTEVSGESIKLDLRHLPGTWQTIFVNPDTGAQADGSQVNGGKITELTPWQPIIWLRRITSPPAN